MTNALIYLQRIKYFLSKVDYVISIKGLEASVLPLNKSPLCLQPTAQIGRYLTGMSLSRISVNFMPTVNLTVEKNTFKFLKFGNRVTLRSDPSLR